MDFIGFFNGNNDVLGQIEGDNAGGILYSSYGSDYAEYLPRLDPDEDIEPADVVGVVGGAVTRRTADAEQALVVSGQPIVTGNAPGYEPDDRQNHETVAFVGQVSVKVRGPVARGDLVVPSGNDDGTARAIAPAEFGPDDGKIVGRAWEGDDAEDVTEVTVAVGLEAGEALAPTLAGQRDRIDELIAENTRKDDRIDALETENEQLRERMTALETRVGAGLPSDD